MATNGSNGHPNKPIIVYGYMPAWGLPDISPFVTKLINYLEFSGIKYEHVGANLARLTEDTPHGKLPVIDDNGTRVADSNTIIEYLESKYGAKLDGDLSKSERAVALAFNRMVEENTYWSGVIQPRWKQDEGFEKYVPILTQGAEVTPPLREFLENFRALILSGFKGQGMGRREAKEVFEFYKADIDALSNFLGEKKYFLGDKIHGIDASVYASLRHFTDQPQKWIGSGYVEKHGNLVNYMERIRAEYSI